MLKLRHSRARRSRTSSRPASCAWVPTLGPILWQLPPQLGFDGDRARDFFAALPRDVAGAERWARRHDARTTGRAALTRRRGSKRRASATRSRSAIRLWLDAEALALMREFDVALVAADTAGRHPLTASSGPRPSPTCACMGRRSCTRAGTAPAELAPWAKRIAAWARGGSDVFVYFDNDARGHAPHDAVRLRRDAGAARGAGASRAGGAKRARLAGRHGASMTGSSSSAS